MVGELVTSGDPGHAIDVGTVFPDGRTALPDTDRLPPSMALEPSRPTALAKEAMVAAFTLATSSQLTVRISWYARA